MRHYRFAVYAIAAVIGLCEMWAEKVGVYLTTIDDGGEIK